MCLAIPARIVEILPGEPRLARVAMLETSRTVNVDLLAHEPLAPGDWVLIHVGFAMVRITDADAREQLSLLAQLGGEEPIVEELQPDSMPAPESR